MRGAPAGRLVVVLLLGLGAACGGGPPEPVRLGRPATTTTSDARPDETTSTVAGGPAAGAAPSSSTPGPSGRSPGAAAPGPGTGPAAAAGPAPPAPGTYRYDTAGATTFGLSTIPYPPVTTLVVEPPAGGRQRSVRDLRGPTGDGAVTHTVLEYRAEGVHLVQLDLVTSVGGLVQTRQLRPAAPALYLPADPAPGFRRQIDLTVSTGGSATAVIEVLATERTPVAGTAVDARVVRLSVSLPPPDSARLELTAWFDPGSRLYVRERSVADATAGLLTLHSQYEATLQRLTPS